MKFKYLKYIGILFFIALVACILNVGKAEVELGKQINKENILIENQDKLEKYKHIPKYKDGDFTYTVNEYLDPKGNRGLQIITEKEENGKVYQKSKGTGVQAEHRTWGWKLIENEHATTTNK